MESYVDARTRPQSFPPVDSRKLVGILLSTAQDPTSFNNFTNSSGGQQLARNFASATGSGGFCIPLDLSNTGISGVSDGANVTLQFLYNGGDGNLYQVSLRAFLLILHVI
jgi:hypothetical protein